MHIALSAHFWGRPTTGSGQYLHRLVEGIVARPELRLTLLADRAAAARGPAPVPLRHLPTPFDGRHAGLAKLWFEQVAVPRAAHAVGADLLHVPYFAPPLQAQLPVVTTIHDLIPLLLPPYRGSRLVRAYSALAARAARGSQRILADSDASRRDILRHLALRPDRVRTVHLAAEERFRPQPAERLRALRLRHTLPDRFVLYLGGFDIRKGVPTLLEATARSAGDWPLVIAGVLPERDSPFAPDPRPIVRRLGLEKRVRFLGWIEDEEKPALLAAADLFVFPSSYEGFGLPVLEAMACGTATVTCNVSSLPELAGDGAALVPPGEAAPLAEMLDHLMAQAAAREALATRGRARAARFSWRETIDQTVATYREAVA